MRFKRYIIPYNTILLLTLLRYLDDIIKFIHGQYMVNIMNSRLKH